MELFMVHIFSPIAQFKSKLTTFRRGLDSFWTFPQKHLQSSVLAPTTCGVDVTMVANEVNKFEQIFPIHRRRKYKDMG
jgi:hypothetical protein